MAISAHKLILGMPLATNSTSTSRRMICSSLRMFFAPLPKLKLVAPLRRSRHHAKQLISVFSKSRPCTTLTHKLEKRRHVLALRSHKQLPDQIGTPLLLSQYLHKTASFHYPVDEVCVCLGMLIFWNVFCICVCFAVSVCVLMFSFVVCCVCVCA